LRRDDHGHLPAPAAESEPFSKSTIKPSAENATQGDDTLQNIPAVDVSNPQVCTDTQPCEEMLIKCAEDIGTDVDLVFKSLSATMHNIENVRDVNLEFLSSVKLVITEVQAKLVDISENVVVTKEHIKNVFKFNEDLRKYAAQLTDLSCELRKKEDENSQCLTMIRELIKQVEELTEKVDSLTAKNSQLQQQVTGLQSEVHCLKAKELLNDVPKGKLLIRQMFSDVTKGIYLKLFPSHARNRDYNFGSIKDSIDALTDAEEKHRKRDELNSLIANMGWQGTVEQLESKMMNIKKGLHVEEHPVVDTSKCDDVCKVITFLHQCTPKLLNDHEVSLCLAVAHMHEMLSSTK
jgi:hypothetical protein